MEIYKCPECNKTASITEWDAQNVPLNCQGNYMYCPNCFKLISTNKIFNNFVGLELS